MAALIKTRTVTVNAAFLAEIKQSHQELWQIIGYLDDLTQNQISSPLFLQKLCAALSQLHGRLITHFSLEEAFGYFDDPIEVAPRISRIAESLRKEHQQLQQSCGDLAERAQHAYDFGGSCELQKLASSFLSFHTRLVNHEEAEIDLIQEAYGDDIGVVD